MKDFQALTFDEYIIQQQTPYAKGELSRLLGHIGIAAKIVNSEINRAGLVDILGEAGIVNIQDEVVQKLDMFANEKFIAALKLSTECCGITSEENQEIVKFDDILSNDGRYIVCMDPLDGSSNIDVNVSIGTIFSIYKRISPRGQKPTEKDFLQPGTRQAAAGYIIYGSSTMFVYTTGIAVTGFTLDPAIGEFRLSHPHIKTSEYGKIYSVNQGNFIYFTEGVKKYIEYCQEKDKDTNRPYSSRYIGSLVADFHRNLLKGGIFMYPKTESAPKGKLRLLYECNPISFIAEIAGGKATNGRNKRIMEIKPDSLHQRVPFFTGSAKMVDDAEKFIDKYEN